MSGFVVSTTHIDALLTCALSLGVELGPGADLDQLGGQLLAANVAAYNAGGADSGAPDMPVPAYRFAALSGTPSVWAALRIADGFAYQVEGSAGWARSPAAAVVAAVRAEALRLMACTAEQAQAQPQYAAVPFHVTEREVFLPEARDGDRLYGDRRRSAAHPPLDGPR